jgi:hypothetical protein
MLQSKFARLGFMAVATALSFGGVAKATYIDYVYNDGSGNVDVTGIGSIDTAALSYIGSGLDYAHVDPSRPLLITGPGVQGAPAPAEVYDGTISGPSTLGSLNGQSDATSGSGDTVGIFDNTAFELPVGYVSGASLTSGAVFAGQSLASLGLATGVYTFDFGSGATADSFIIDIGATPPASSVPEPASIAAAGLALPALSLFAWKRRKATG